MDAAAAQHGDREAYVEGSTRMSFTEWHRAADGLAATLVERGILPGDVVAVHLPPSIDYAVTYAAVVRAGAVATGINTRLGLREISAIMEQCCPALVVRDHEIEVAGGDPLEGWPTMYRGELAGATARAGLGDDRPDRRASDPVVIIWTSGTTGTPKGAWFDHRNLEAAVASAGVMSAPYDRRLVGTPFAHAGYMAKLWEQLAWGSAVVISPIPWSVDDMLRLLVDERISVAAAVPTQWAKLVEHPSLAGSDLSHLRVGLVATAPAPPELIRSVEAALGCPLIVRYAMTESPSITGTEPGDPPEVLQRTVGRAQSGVEVAVVDETGRPVPDGTIGRVRVRGCCVMRGYWGAPELTGKVLDPHGWLTSSDLGSIDPAGNLVLVGRVDDMYIRGGYNVYPVEVEDVLLEHPLVARAAVVGVETPVIGQIGVAFVVPSDPTDPPSTPELREWVRAHLADYKAPDEVRLVEELPQTAMAKIDKVALRAHAGPAMHRRRES